MPGLVGVLRAEGIEGVRYALWDMTTGRHRDYDPCIRRAEALPAEATCRSNAYPTRPQPWRRATGCPPLLRRGGRRGRRSGWRGRLRPFAILIA